MPSKGWCRDAVPCDTATQVVTWDTMHGTLGCHWSFPVAIPIDRTHLLSDFELFG